MKKFTKEEDKFIVENYPVYGLKYCADKLNRNVGTIQYRRKFLKLPLLSKEMHSKILKGKTKPNANLEQNVPDTGFKFPITPETAYVLGLLWADGYVKSGEKIVITGTEEDLAGSINTILKTGKWKVKKFKVKRYDVETKDILRITTSNIRLTKYLESKGYRSKSTGSACDILNTIPEYLRYYWFRGLFDGDGWITILARSKRKTSTRIGFSSSYQQDWTYLEKICNELGIKYSIYRRNVVRKNGKINSSSSLSVYSQDGCKRFFNYIYKNRENDNIGLDRKYYKWKEFLNSSSS